MSWVTMKITSDLYKVHRDLKKTAAHCKIRVVEFLKKKIENSDHPSDTITLPQKINLGIFKSLVFSCFKSNGHIRCVFLVRTTTIIIINQVFC